MSGLVGTRLGAYEITGALGAGGMGEVYRARDSRLNRDVALKVLPELFARDTDRLARFKREAQVLASLNHPNIAAIYGFEESDSAAGSEPVRALVLELVEGPTLADVIARGPIALGDALALARQMADALEAAHERGVIHRDLKPANIKLRPDGTVKVLDFGLAKAFAPADSSSLGTGDSFLDGRQISPPFESPTITSPAMTAAGIVLGTAAYMSPEQAKGRPADKRSDVWAFGCVLFEMLSARRPFAGEDVADTLAFVLTREPDWAALPATVPPSVHTLLRRCLQRDRKKRLADIADARWELDEALSASAPGGGAGTGSPSATAAPLHHRSMLWAAGGVVSGLLLALVGGVVWNGPREPPMATAIRFTVDPPDGVGFPLANSSFVSVSPDGRQILFTTGQSRNDYRLWVRPVNALAARELPGSEGARDPLWSPDSRSVVFSAGPVGLGPLRKIDLLGGPPLTLASQGQAGAWSTDGLILFQGADRRIYRVSDRGGDAVAVTELDSAAQEIQHFPRFFLPDNRRFAFVSQSTDRATGALFLASIDGGPRTKLLDAAWHAQRAGDLLVYHRDGKVLAQPFDAAAGRLIGDATLVLEHVAFDRARGNAASFSVSAGGHLAYRVGEATSRRAQWVDLTGKPLGSITIDDLPSAARRPSLSHDGKQLALTRSSEAGKSDVWIFDLERNVPTRITFDEASISPVWSPDDTKLAYWSTRPGATGLYIRALASSSDELVYAASSAATPTAWSPDGSVLLLQVIGQKSAEVWGLRLNGDRKPFALVNTGFFAGHAMFSQDGKWFAYCEGDSGDQVYAQPFPPDGRRVRLSATTGAAPQWGSDGKRLIYATAQDELMMVAMSGNGPSLRFEPAKPLFKSFATFGHRSVLFDAVRSRILLRETAESTQRPTLQVVLNWTDELRAASRARVGAQ